MARDSNDLFRVHVVVTVEELTVEFEVEVHDEEGASQMENR